MITLAGSVKNSHTMDAIRTKTTSTPRKNVRRLAANGTKLIKTMIMDLIQRTVSMAMTTTMLITIIKVVITISLKESR